MTRTILRSLFDRLGNTAAKWAACLLATVSISTAWGDGTVAKIGTTEYPTLAGAVAEAAAEDTIQLTADCSMTAYIQVNKNITLDLNGQTLAGGNNMFYVTSGKLTIQDTSEGASGVYTSSAGTGDYNTAPSGYKGAVTLRGGSFELKSGTVNGSSYAVRTATGSGTITVSGGTLTGMYPIYDGQGTYGIEVTGGKLTTSFSNASAIHKTTAGSVTISGGEIEALGNSTINTSCVKCGQYGSGSALLTITGGMFNAPYGCLVEMGTGKLTVTDINVTKVGYAPFYNCDKINTASRVSAGDYTSAGYRPTLKAGTLDGGSFRKQDAAYIIDYLVDGYEAYVDTYADVLPEARADFDALADYNGKAFFLRDADVTEFFTNRDPYNNPHQTVTIYRDANFNLSRIYSRLGDTMTVRVADNATYVGNVTFDGEPYHPEMYLDVTGPTSENGFTTTTYTLKEHPFVTLYTDGNRESEGVSYGTVESAINTIATGNTDALIVAEEGIAYLSAVVGGNNRSFTYDLNGQQITGSAYNIFLSPRGSGSVVNVIDSAGTATVNSTYNFSGTGLIGDNYKNGTLNVHGGEYTAKIVISIGAGYSPVFNIDGGTYNGKVNMANGVLNISDNSIFNGAFTLSNTAAVNITGGYFNEAAYNSLKDSANVTLPEGKALVKATGEYADYYTVGIAPAYVAQIGETKYETLAEALAAAASAPTASTVEVLVDEIDCAGWTSVTVGSASPLVTLDGKDVVLKNLSAPLFNKTGSGCKGVAVKNVTVKDAAITTSSYAAAFLPYADSTETAYFENCHIVDSAITSTGTYAGGFVAYAAGYNNQNDGPVFTTVTIKDCSVKNSMITGGNSTGSLMGHATGSAWTLVNVDDTEVSGNTIICTDDSNVKAGALFGTVGAAGQESYGQTGGIVVGGDTVVKGNTMTSNGVASEQIFGRIGSSGGALAVTGGTYDGTANYANDTYDSTNGKIIISGGSFKTAPSADALADGYAVTGTPNADGYYTLEDLPVIATVTAGGTTKNYYDLHAALEAGKASGTTITLLTDVDLSGVNWVPVGTSASPFTGVFDGNGKTISNLSVNDEALTYAGLLGYVTGSTFKNITLRNVTVHAEATIGSLMGYCNTSSVMNCHVQGRIQLSGHYKMGGILGEGYTSFTDCSVIGDGESTSFILATPLMKTDDPTAYKHEADNIGGMVGHWSEGAETIKNCTVKDISVTGYRKLGGMVGISFCSQKIEDVTVENVKVTCTAPKAYAEDNTSTTGMGGIVGQYHRQGGTYTGGWMKGATIKNVILEATDSEALGIIKAGLVSSGLRDSAAAESPISKASMTFSDIVFEGENSIPDGVKTMNDAAFGPVYVAQIGTTKYETLAEALADAQNDETVKILTDIALSEKLVIPDGKDVTIDLNGKTITNDDVLGAALGSNKAIIDVSGILSFVDSAGGGKVESVSAMNQAETIHVNATGSLNVTGIAVSSVGTGTYKKIINVQGGKVVANNATISGTAVAYGIMNAYKATTEITVVGGTINVPGGTAISGYNGKVTVNGAALSGSTGIGTSGGINVITDATITAKVGISAAGNGTTTIDGGTISAERNGVTLTAGTLNITGATVTGAECSLDIYKSASPNINVFAGDDAVLNGDMYIEGSGTSGTHQTNIGIGTGSTVNGQIQIFNEYETEGFYGGNIEILGTVNGGEKAAIFVSGNLHEGTTTITIGDGAAVTSASATGISLNGYAVLNVMDGAAVTGTTGIEVRAGSLNVTGGTITETASSLSEVANSSGSSVTGAAVAICQHVTQLPISVSIAGGTFDATAGGVAIYETDIQNGSVVDETINMSGGAFNGGVQSLSVGKGSVGITFNISGGVFVSEVSDAYCADGYVAVGNADELTKDVYPWMVGRAVAQIGDVKYVTFADAIEAAEEYKTENGDYPVITVLNGATEQDNPDWKIDNGYLVRKVYVAQIGTTKYETIAEAIDAVENDQTIELLSDSNVVTEYTKSIGDSGYSEGVGGNRLVIDCDKTFTLDLGGNTLSGRINFLHGNMTVVNGTFKASTQALNIYGTKDYAYAGQGYSVVTVASDVTIEANYGLVVFGGDPNNGYYPLGFGEVFHVYGKVYANSPVFVSGNVGMDTYVENCGTLADVEALKESTGKKVSELMSLYGPTINIYDGAEFVATPSATASDSSQGISLSGCAIVNMMGGSISGAEGVGIKGGVLNVSGGTITGTGAKCDPVQAVNSGTESSGAAISASTHYNANYPISITVSGGTIKSVNNAALLVAHSNKDGVPEKAVSGIAANVTGGTFIGGSSQEAVIIEEALEGEDSLYPEKFISAGFFSAKVAAAYVASGYLCTTKPVANGMYQVVPAATVTYTLAGDGDPTGAALPSPASFAYPSGDLAEIALAIATCTSSDYTFAGWKVAGSEGAAISVLPSGTAGNVTLVATWTVVEPITVEGSEGSGEQSPTAAINLPKEWLDAVPEEGSGKTNKELLNEVEDNGFKKWENYVLGLDGSDANAKVGAVAEQGLTTMMPVESTVRVTTVDTGFTVKYQLNEVDEDGETVTGGEGTPQDTPELSVNLSDVDGVSYYKVVATIKSPEGETMTTATSENIIGVLKVESSVTTTAVAVPWASYDGTGPISVADIVRTANLTEGDSLKAYDLGSKTYKEWTLGADKTWQPSSTISTSGNESAGNADAYKVARGSAVWLTRADPSQPIYLVGGAASGTVETELEAAPSETKSSWNLVGNPKVESVDVKNLLGAKTGDQVIVPTAGAPKNYVYVEGKGWGYYKTVPYEIDGVKVGVQSVFTTDDTYVPAGAGFWYLNSSTSKDAKINW